MNTTVKKNEQKGNGFRFSPTDGSTVASALTTHSSNGRMTDNFVVGMLGGKYEKALDCNRRVYSVNGTSPTITTCGSGNSEPKVVNHKKIRKLTPKECWRLMGLSDEDFFKAEQVNSNCQLYKQAGNSIVVDVLYHIFRELL